MKHTNRRRALISVLLAVLVFAGAVTMPILQTDAHAVTQYEIDRKKAEKNALSKKIKEQQELMNALKSEQSGIMEQKEALDQQQTLKTQEINLVHEELTMYRQLILDKEYEARIAQEHAEEQLAIYKAHIRNMEEQGINNMYLQLLFSSSSMTDLLSRVDMVSEIMEYDKRIHDNYVSAKQAALTAKEEAEAAAAQLAVKEQELQTEIDRLTGELEGLQTELDRLMSDIDGYAAVINKYAADEARIDKEIKQMAEELKKQQTPPTSTGSFMWPLPVSKGISSGYGMRKISLYGYEKFHAGIDVPAGIGNSILAADGGTVIVSTYDGGYGNYVMINHGGGRVTLYAHMSSRAVDVGAEVKKGQVIGSVGSTGNSTGPHLHFEIRINGSAVDPCTYFTGYYFTKK